MIYGFFGDIGSGKTLTMTRYAYAYYLAGYKIFSNYNLNFPHEKITPDLLKQIVREDLNFDGKTIFCLDEFDMWVDSRSSMSKTNKIIGYFTKQVRKKKIQMLIATQFKHTLDKRVRGLIRITVLCEPKTFDLKYKDDTVEPLLFIYTTYEKDGRVMFKKRFFANPFFNLYDTEELISLDEDL